MNPLFTNMKAVGIQTRTAYPLRKRDGVTRITVDGVERLAKVATLPSFVGRSNGTRVSWIYAQVGRDRTIIGEVMPNGVHINDEAVAALPVELQTLVSQFTEAAR